MLVAVYFHTIILLDIALFDDFLLILRMENVCINLIFSTLKVIHFLHICKKPFSFLLYYE